MKKALSTLFFILAIMIHGVVSAQDVSSKTSIFQVEHHIDWIQPTTGPERTVLFGGYHITFMEVGRFNFGGIGIGAGMKRLTPGYHPYVPVPRQVEMHPLITSHVGFRVMKGEDYWFNIAYMYDPIRKASMVGFGLSAF